MRLSILLVTAALSITASCPTTGLGSVIARFAVSSTSVVNGDAPHGLWTSSDFAHNYWDINSGTYFTIDDNGTPGTTVDDTATLIGSATNAKGDVADLYLNFSGFLDSLDTANSHNYKVESGLPYDALTMDFFESVSGTIEFASLGKTVTIDRMVEENGKDYTFQFGLGANAKSPTEFGGSAWIQSSSSVPLANQIASHHWDLNLTLHETPEPATIVIWSLILLGCCVNRFHSASTR